MTAEHELVLTRLIDAPRENLFRCWTEPGLLKQWFAPAPITTPVAEVDLRVGGASRIVMQAPDGKEFPCPGTYLEIVPNRKLVFTDAYTGDWMPKTAGKPFMTAIITFDDEDGKTRYTARVRHWIGGRQEDPRGDGFSRRLGPVRRSARGARQNI